MTENGLIVGIDLGTTNSVVAIWDAEKKEALAINNLERAVKYVLNRVAIRQ